MKRVNSVILFFLIGCAAGQALWSAPLEVAPSTPGITLQDCFERARKLNESISISAENTKLLQKEYRAELGAIFPHIDWIKSQFYQQSANAEGSGVGGSLARTTQPESYFQLQQPLYAGSRDWQTIRILKSQESQARINEEATNLQLLSDVAAAFYAAYNLQDQLSILLETRKLNQNQVDQLNHWVNIGRSRPSEVLSAETQLASIDAQIEDVKRMSAEARHLLFFLTGVTENVILTDVPPAPPALTVDEAITRASKRPDLRSAAEALQQAELMISFQKGGHLPTLGLTAHYFTERVGFLTDVRWDATFLLDVPIYEGGSTQANVEAARSQEIIAQLTLGHLKRDVERQVRTAYDTLVHSLTEAQAYDKAVQLAAKNYEVQQKEYRLGIITNLELLQLLTNMQNIRGQWLISRATAKLNEVNLKVALGEGF